MTQLDFDRARVNMITQQLRTWDVLDQRVLDAVASVPRERFVPERWRNLAFADLEIPIGHDQVMMTPKVEGRLLQTLEIAPTDRILEIGTGTGYLTACLARLGGSVVTVDIFGDFSESATARLEALGIHNVEYRTGDAARGWEEDGTFDVIAITGSLHQLERGHLELLNLEGRMFVVVGEPPAMEARLITRHGEEDWAQEDLFETDLPRLLNAPDRRGFQL